MIVVVVFRLGLRKVRGRGGECGVLIDAKFRGFRVKHNPLPWIGIFKFQI